ncbi:hypothetical protein FQR65_LT06431 [Abscondita terminalis]|nr:hypothetical protein FQR65_LT06431 [Abscondita terminalis]
MMKWIQNNKKEIKSTLYDLYYSKTTRKWIEDKKKIDDLDGLWRIHDNLYDVTNFINKHPGGKFWLETTKGMDITEAFESHHIKSDAPEMILQNFFIKKATKPRTSPYTLYENGFYKTLKTRVRTALKTLPKDSHKMTNLYIDLLFISTFLFAWLGTALSMYPILMLSSICCGLTISATHNYSHQRDNFRMFYSEFFLFRAREFRIIHVLSHHAFPNSRLDLQLTIALPFLNLFPEKKSFVLKYLSWITCTFIIFPFIIIIFNAISFVDNFIQRQNFNIGMPFVLPLSMYYFNNNQTLLTTIAMWQLILVMGNAIFATTAFTISHIHPNLYTEGDAIRPTGELDWGINQLDTVYDRPEIKGNDFLTLVTFGDHAVHHMFPTIDHAYLKYLNPIFEKTLREFNIKNINMTNTADVYIGFFRQAARELPKSTPPSFQKLYPSNSGKSGLTGVFSSTLTRNWLEMKRNADDLDGLWRIHDNLYDVTEFIDEHPGGRFWLEETKGMDVTEAFETHHLKTDPPEHLLQKYFVKKITKPRVSPYTFHEDGFYKTLKKNVRDVLKTLPEESLNMSNVYTDLLLLTTFTFACLANSLSCFFAILAGISGTFLIVASHNYVHQRDNIRMFYGNTVIITPGGLRVMHILSHHLFPNSQFDLQLTCLFPMLNMYPAKKSFLVKYVFRLTAIISVFPFIFYMCGLDSIIEMVRYKRNYVSGMLPLTLPTAMFCFGNSSLMYTFLMWQLILILSSTVFGIIAYTTTHAHPNLYTEGDARRPAELDWGINQLDTVYDRKEIMGSHFMSLISFGDHALHHLFPTLDQKYLKHLYPILQETLKMFNIKDINMTTSADLFVGFYKQAGREVPNSDPPSLLKPYLTT